MVSGAISSSNTQSPGLALGRPATQPPEAARERFPKKVAGLANRSGSYLILICMERRGHRKLRRKLVLLSASIFALFVLGYLIVPILAPSLVGLVLEKNLHLPVHIGELKFSVTRNSITMTDLRLSQPKGFEHEPMLSVGRVEVDGWTGFLFGPRHLAEIRISGVVLNITTSSDNQTNLSVLMESSPGESEESTPAENEDSSQMMGMKFDRIIIDPIDIFVRDYSGIEDEISFTLKAGALEVVDLTLGPYPESPNGSVNFTGEIVQDETANAKFIFAARLEPIRDGVPYVLGSTGVIGALYQTFVPAIPAGTDMLLGGKGFDLNVDMAHSGGKLLVVGDITTSSGSSYPFRISGPVDALVFELPEKLASTVARMTGGVGRLLGSTIHSGKEIVVGAVDTAASFGKGTVHATGSFLKGIARMSTGVVTGDGEARKKGLDEMTSETGENLSGAVSESTDAIGKAGGRTSDAIANDPKMISWIEEIPDRYEEWLERDGLELSEAPFPLDIPELRQDGDDQE